MNICRYLTLQLGKLFLWRRFRFYHRLIYCDGLGTVSGFSPHVRTAGSTSGKEVPYGMRKDTVSQLSPEEYVFSYVLTCSFRVVSLLDVSSCFVLQLKMRASWSYLCIMTKAQIFYPAFIIEVSIGDDLHPCCLSFSFMPYCYGCFQHRKLLRRDAGVTMDVSSYLRLKAILAFINSVLTLLENRWPRYPGRVLSSVLTAILMG